MIATTINGQSGFLLDIAPDWNSPFRVDFELVASVEPGLTDREVRRLVANTLRLKVGFSATAFGLDARRVANAFAAYTGQPVGVPLWGCVTKWSQTTVPPIVGGLSIGFKDDWSQWAIYSDTPPAWLNESHNVAPLVVGRLDRRELRWESPAVCTFSVSLVESSPAHSAVTATLATFADGPSPGPAYSTRPKMFPLAVDYQAPAESWAVTVVREDIGFGRQPVETVYSDAPAYALEASLAAFGAQEIGSLLRFFQTHGHGKAFWIPQVSNVAVLMDDIGELAFAAPMDSTAGINPGDWIAFWAEGGAKFAKVESATVPALFFVSSPGFVPAGTMTTRMSLVRFTRPRLTLQWITGDLATCSLTVRELPAEYTPADGETLGHTIGESWTRCYLYEITQRRAAGPYVERLTSFEQDVVISGVTYTAARIGHGEVARGIALDRDRVSIQADLNASEILKGLALLRSLGPIGLVILEAAVDRLDEFGGEFGGDYQ